ncbi:MAG: prepilin-type N-terminal cleavage/methylation domain-containing protein [Fimbriimonadaceae bacterium]|nr:prepilin-type N-terminal cleavage/methylation domain-containing protein [Fimbriimonadaceae bacterium]
MIKKAFTLIELLVVIAIIAILAAILFPVFAQAKVAAKKAATISNQKQLGTAFNIYTADYDDVLPLAHSIRADGTHRYSTIHPTPNGAIASGWDDPLIMSQVASQWANAMQPYMKNWDILNSPSQNAVTIPGEVFTNTVKPATVGSTYNGLLHTFSMTGVNNPSVVPLIWTGTGNTSLNGRSTSNPALRCTTSGPCHFNPGGPVQAGLAEGNQTAFFGYGNYSGSYHVWTFGNNHTNGGVVFSRVDSSAKYQRVGVALDPNVNLAADKDPYALVRATPIEGQSWAYWGTNDNQCGNLTDENTSGGYRYVCFFRPDRDQ